jgi:uncharacterized protein
MIQRTLSKILLESIDFKKAIILLGPRQVGKTTILKELVAEKNTLFIDGDDIEDRLTYSNPKKRQLLALIADYEYIFIDEAQRFENIGLTIKMIIDAKLNKQVIVSGSSAFELANTIQEPLTGRKWEYNLFPLSWAELKKHFKLAQLLPMLDDILIYGSYPDVITATTKKEQLLKSLAGSYLYKDILELADIKKPDLLVKLLKALAFQIGSEVNFNELSNSLQVDRQTIIRYIDLLEKCFVIFKLQPFSGNLRNEITAKPKIYFYDLGVRNAIISNFEPLANRQDVGLLFENFFIAERLKIIAYEQKNVAMHYWRNTQQAEIDYLEVSSNMINAYELKWNPKTKVKFSKSFTENYNPQNTVVVNKENFWEYL